MGQVPHLGLEKLEIQIKEKTGMVHFPAKNPHLYLNRQLNEENNPDKDNPSPVIKVANLMTPLVALPTWFTVSLEGILRESEVGKEKEHLYLQM